MRYFANYAKAVQTAEQVLEDYGISQVPVRLEQILSSLSNEIGIMPYTKLMQKHGLSYTEVIEMVDSDLGACAYDPCSARYVIYYNDKLSKPWCRFTICHELGHIFLEHHLEAGTNILCRSFIPKKDYKEYEKEADVFARTLLSPAPLAQMIIAESSKFSQINDVSSAFNITEKAARMRIDFILRDLKDCTQQMKDFFERVEILYRRSCTQCGYALPREYTYCPICGGNRKIRRLNRKKLPESIPIDPFGSVFQCVRCGNENIGLGARYCRICGAPVVNMCTGRQDGRIVGQRHHNPSYARFCIDCGAPTLFQEYLIDQEVEAMIQSVNYNDGVPFDEETLRVETCPKCGNQEFSENAMFCRICGTSIYNMCEGETDNNGYGEYIVDGSQHRNPSNARYCETCGKPTYFLSKNILCDFTKFVPEGEDGAGNDDIFRSMSGTQQSIYQEIAATPESEGYALTAAANDDNEELPF